MARRKLTEDEDEPTFSLHDFKKWLQQHNEEVEEKDSLQKLTEESRKEELKEQFKENFKQKLRKRRKES